MYQELPYTTAVTLLPYRIANKLSKAQSVQFGAEPCGAPLACFVGVNQKYRICSYSVGGVVVKLQNV